MNKYFKFSFSMLIIASIIVLLPAMEAIGDTYSVPTQFSTIGKALDTVAEGDMIKVAGGVYFEHITLKEGVVLQGGWSADFSKRDISNNETVIDGIKEKGPTVVCANNAVLDGFTVTHATLKVEGDISEGSGLFCEGTSPTIINNTIKNNEPSGVFCSEGSMAKISDNRIHDNAQAGVYVQKGSKVELYRNTIWGNKFSGIGSGKLPVANIIVRNNTIFRNKRSGINALFATGNIENNIIYENVRAGINCNTEPMSIINNTIVGNGWGGLLVESSKSVVTIKNNILSHNVDTGIRTAGRGFSHNLLFANAENGDCNTEYLWCVRSQYGGYGDENSYKKHGGIIADPLFVDAENHDYHLRGTSPAIDAGDKKAEYNDVNFPSSLGAARNDMGAYGGPQAIVEKAKNNNAPMADGGPDMEAVAGKRIILDGRGSSDPDGDVLSYKWKIISTPKSSKAKLAKAKRNRCGLKVDKTGIYVVELVVTDQHGLASKPAMVEVTVPENRPPKANIGEALSLVSAGDSITLYGSSSKDPEGASLRYKWSVQFKPANSQAVIMNADSENSTLTVDVDGGYLVQLIVNDGIMDSEPATVNISTRNPVNEGIRNVPSEYPTIQAALDAAQDGDDIIVQKGEYHEKLVIDKSVDLIGVDWPVLNGGSQSGNKNTIAVFYLGDRAGKIEGFEITGSGRGLLGHGINVWDSSPEISNNKITRNVHGIGIHGSPTLTEKTKVHANLIYDNYVGIGNGKDSAAQIFNNRVYNNHIVGIGSRGKGAPRIKENYIYENRIGIGAREVASPYVEGNHIFGNTVGIVISPLSTIKKFAFNDIIIHNNLIANNDRLGISITSFNLTKVVITGNTIDSNNKASRRIRAGGVVLGYPHPATFSAVLENNIISNNRGGGVIKYTGPENFPEPGADLSNNKNNVWNNQADFIGSKPGPDSLSNDPGYVSMDMKSENAYATKLDVGYKYSQAAFADLPPER